MIFTMSILKVEITSEMVAEAEKRNKENWEIYHNTGTLLTEKTEYIRKFGYLGEAIVCRSFPKLKYTETPTHDLEFNSFRFEVKSKSCNTMPKDNYTASVMAYQKDRELDYFIFTRIIQNCTYGWILGWITKERFFEDSKLIRKGTKNKNFTVDNDRYCIKIGELNNPYDLIR